MCLIYICRQWEFLAPRPRVSPRQLWAHLIGFCPLGGRSSTPYRSHSLAPPWWLGDLWSSPRRVNRCPPRGPWSSPTPLNTNHRGPKWWSPKPASTHRPYREIWLITADSSDPLSQLSSYVTIVINNVWLNFHYSQLFDWLLSLTTHSIIMVGCTNVLNSQRVVKLLYDFQCFKYLPEMSQLMPRRRLIVTMLYDIVLVSYKGGILWMVVNDQKCMLDCIPCLLAF